MKTKILPTPWKLSLLLTLAISHLCRPANAAQTIIVTSLADNGPGTLRNAIVAAADGDTIQVQAGLGGTINLNSELSLTRSLTILGLGPRNSSIDNTSSRVFHL